MANTENNFEKPSWHHFVFQTKLSGRAAFSDLKFGDFTSNMKAAGIVIFKDGDRIGPYTCLHLSFYPRPASFYIRKYCEKPDYWSVNNYGEPSLDKSPKEFLNNKELLIPFVHRLASVALLLEQLPEEPSETFPKLEGKITAEMITDLNLFLQNPSFRIDELSERYGIDLSSYANSPDNINSYREKIASVHHELVTSMKTLLEI